MGEWGSLGHPPPDTLAQICSILIKGTHFLQLAVHSEWQPVATCGLENNACALFVSRLKVAWKEKSKYSSGFGSFKDFCSARSQFHLSAAFMDFFYIIIMLMFLQGTSVRFVNPLLSLTDQCKNPGADHTGVQKPSNKLLSAQIFG